MLSTPQSGGWVTRIGIGISTEQPQELLAMQMDQADACTMQITERKAQITHSAQKRKECPMEVEQIYNQTRYTESTQMTPEVQKSWEAYSHSTFVNQPSRPIMESKQIQQQGQVQPRRTLLSHGKGSTRNSRDVSDTGKMAASPWKVPATAPLTSTSQGIEWDYETSLRNATK